MNCPNCGTENSPHARFCQRCGFDIKSTAVEKPEQQVNGSSDTPTVQSQATESPANPAQREEIVIPSPSTTPAAPLQPTLAGVPVQPASMGTQANPLFVTIVPSLPYAGFWLRALASLIDGLLIGAVTLPFVLVLVIMNVIVRRTTDFTPDFGITAAGNIFTFFVNWLYYALMESSSKQGTLGKMAMGLKVTDLNGNRITFGRATGRYFGRILSGLILDIGFLMIAFTAKKQGLHDMLAGTLVVKK